MTTCIKCRQEYSGHNHECIAEMTLEEVYEPTDEMVPEVLDLAEREWRRGINEREVLELDRRRQEAILEKTIRDLEIDEAGSIKLSDGVSDMEAAILRTLREIRKDNDE